MDATTSEAADKMAKLSDKDSAGIEQLKAQRKAQPRAPLIKLGFEDDTRTLTTGFDHKDEVAGHALASIQMCICDERYRPVKTERGSETDPSGSSVVPIENPKPLCGSK